jgi:hypothetical protein
LLLVLLSLLCGVPEGLVKPQNGRDLSQQSGLAEYCEKPDFTGPNHAADPQIH